MRRFLYRVEAITAAAVKTTNVAVAPDGHRAMFVGRAPNAEEWCLTNIAEADTTESVEDGLRLYTTKITVTTHRHTPLATTAALLLTDAEGARWLVGGKGPTDPLFTTEQHHPGEFNSPTVVVVNITWTSVFPMLEII